MRKSNRGGALFSHKDVLQAVLVCFILVAVLFTPLAPVNISPEASAAPTGTSDQESNSPGLNTWNTTTVSDFQNGTFNDTQAIAIDDGALTLDYDTGGTRGNVFGDVLVIKANAVETNVFAALAGAGFSVTDGGLYSAYDPGSGSPNPNNFKAVLLLSGNSALGMPAGGEAALISYVQNGGGIVYNEWFALQVGNGRYTTLAPLLCTPRLGGAGVSETYTLVPPQMPHPILSGLPSNFVVPYSSISNMGTPLYGARPLIAGSSSTYAVTVKQFFGGRVVQMATAGLYNGNDPWVDANMQRLLANSVGWVQNDTSPVIQPSIPNPPAVDEETNHVLDLSGYEFDHDDMRIIDLYEYWHTAPPENTASGAGDRGVYITPINDITITKIGWFADVPAQVLTATVYSTGGLFTRGAAIGSGTLDTTGSTGYTWHDIPLTTPVTLSAGVQYDISVQWSSSNGWLWQDDRVILPFIRGDVIIEDGESTGFAGDTRITPFRMYSDQNDVFSSTKHASPLFSGDWTLGWSFRPSVDIHVHAFRHYFGTKISIWNNVTQALIYSQIVTSIDGNWMETNLVNPIMLEANQEYLISTYTGGGNYYWQFPGISAGNTYDKIHIQKGFEINGDQFPSTPSSSATWGVDLVYTEGTTELDWTVTGYDAGAISSIAGQNSANDVLTFTPVKDYFGSTVVNLRCTDSNGNYAEQLVTLTFNNVNDPPTGPPPSTWTNLGNRLTDHTPLVTWAHGDDPDGDTLTYFVFSQNGSSGEWGLDRTTTGTSTQLNLWDWQDGEWGRWFVAAYDGEYWSDSGFLASSTESLDLFYSYSYGDGTFDTEVDLGDPGDRVRGIGIGDFDNDGDYDLIHGDYETVPTGVRLLYYEKTDHGPTFAAPVDLGQYTTGSYPMDFAVEDFNNDNNLDIALGTNSVNVIVLFGAGDGSFGSQTTLTLLGGSDRGKGAADLDLDGDMDLVVGSTGTNVYWFENNGDGTFQGAAVAATAAGSTQYGITVNDFDNDSYPDLIETPSNTGDIYFHKGNGDGTFQGSSLLFSVDPYYTVLDSLDFDKDGNYDLVVNQVDTGEVLYYTGLGTGSFGAPTVAYDAATGSHWGFAAPVRNTDHFQFNQKPNIPVRNKLGDRLLDHTPTASWAPATDPDGDPVTYFVDSRVNNGAWVLENGGTALTTEVLDENTWLDGDTGGWRVRSWDGYQYSSWDTIITEGEDGTGIDSINRYNTYGDDIYLSNGDGRIVAETFESDGISFFQPSSNNYMVFDVSDLSGQVLNMTFFAQMYQSQPFRDKELTLEGGPAIGTYNQEFYREIYQINNTGTYINFTEIDIPSNPYYLRLSLTGGESSNTFAFDWYYLRSTANIDLFAMNDAPEMPTGTTDLVTLASPTPSVSWDPVGSSDYGTDDGITYYVYSMNQTGQWALDETTTNTFCTLDAWDWSGSQSDWGRWYVVAEDDTGERSDNGYILVAGDNGQSWYIRNNGDGTFGPVNMIYDSGTDHHRGGGIGDFDNDGDFDFVRGHENSGWYYYYEQIAPEVFAAPVQIGTSTMVFGNYEIATTVADFDHDNNLDFVASGLNDDIYLYMGNGDGTFTGPTAITTNAPDSSTRGLSAGDVDNDGNDDLIYGSDLANYYAYYGDGTGNFGIPQLLFNSGLGFAYMCAAADYNNDGYLDIMAGSSGGANVLYLGDGGSTWNNMGLKISTGNWNRGDAYDFDHDGWEDLAVPVYTTNAARMYISSGGVDPTFAWTDTFNVGDQTLGIAAPTLVSDHFHTNAPPLGPTGVSTALGGDGDDVLISWTNSTSPDVVYYEVFHSNDGTTWDFGAPVGTNIMFDNWLHTDEANDEHPDFYIVRGVDSGGLNDGGTSAQYIYEWVITGSSQSRTSITINTPNSITVYSNLSLTDTTLYCKKIDIEAGAGLYADPTIIYAEDDVTIAGTLLLDDTILRINGAFSGHRQVNVQVGGQLTMIANSTVESNNTFKYNFWVDGGLQVENSTIRDAGYDIGGSSDGVRITSNSNYLYNATIEDGEKHGIVLFGDDNQLLNSTIRNFVDTGVQIYGEGNTIWDTNITNGRVGILNHGNFNHLLNSYIEVDEYCYHSWSSNLNARVENSTLIGLTNQEGAFFLELSQIGMIIANNSITYTGDAIYGEADYATIRDNDFFATQRMINLLESSNLHIINNTGDSLSEYGLFFENSDNLTITNNNITNAGDSGDEAGVHLWNVQNALISWNNFSGSYIGVYIRGNSPSYSENIDVDNNQMYNMQDKGITFGAYSRNCNITNNVIYGAGNDGIQIANSNNLGHRLEGNNISYCNGHGIYIGTGTHDVLSNDIIYPVGNGIRVEAGAGTGNVLDDNLILIDVTGSSAIQLGVSGTTISNNTITLANAGYFAVYLNTFDSNTVENNTILTTTSSSFGIYGRDGSTNNVIQYNTLDTTGTTAMGIHLYTGAGTNDGNVIRNNTITTQNTGAYGMYLSGTMTVYNNNITTYGTDGNGVYASSIAGTTFTNNDITTNGGSAPALFFTSSSNVIVSGGTYTTIGGSSYGVQAQTSTSARLLGITVSVRNTIGAYILSSQGAELSNSTITCDVSDAVAITSSNDLIMRDNQITTDNRGIYVSNSANSRVENNTISNPSVGGTGIVAYNTITNTVFGNNTITLMAVGMNIHSAASPDSYFYNNNIINNTVWGVDIDDGSGVTWIVDDVSDIQNNPVNMEGNISILSGGNMYWDNSGLMFGPSYDGQYKIEVAPGGYLGIEINSVFESSTSFKYDFWANGSIQIENSTIQDVGYAGSGSRGVRIGSSNNLFYNATIEDGYLGILIHGNFNTFISCTIRNMFDFGWEANGNNNTLRDGNITNVQNGVYLGENDNIILDSYIDASEYAIYSDVTPYRSIIDNNMLSGGLSDGTIFVEGTLYDTVISNNTFFNDNTGASIQGVNLTIRDNIILTNTLGIYVYGDYLYIINNTGSGFASHGIGILGGSTNAIVEYNTITNAGGNGLHMFNIDGATIQYNNFTDNGNGVSDSGIYSLRSSNLNIQWNNVSGSHNGIGVEGISSDRCEYITIYDNQIYDVSQRGIYLVAYARYNNISYNTIQNAGNTGIYCISTSNDNTIWHNRIIANFIQAQDSGINNKWFNGYPMGGNYWGDHTSPDANIDGYVDNVYNIGGVASSFDPYPFVRDYGWDRLAPTTPGDWNITWTQRYHNQTIEFDGDMIIPTGNVVFIDDVNLSIGNVTLFALSVLEMNRLDAYVDNVVIKNRGIMAIDPTNIWVDGDMWIDGQFSMDNDNLWMNQSFNGDNNIYINSTGEFIAQNGSVIRANPSTMRYNMVVRQGGNLNLRDSTLRECGWNDANKGLQIYSDNVVLEAITFLSCHYAVSFNGTSSVNVYNSTVFPSCTNAFYLENSSAVRVVNTTTNGLAVNYGDLTSTFYLIWYLHVHVENDAGSDISNAEVTVLDGYGSTVTTQYTNTRGWVRDIECEEYVETLAARTTHPQPYSISAVYGGISTSANEAMDEGSGGSRELFLVLSIPAYLPDGEYISEVYNAGYKAFWSYIAWEYDQPVGTNITVETRTGPNSDPATPTWSGWIEANTSSGSAINAPQWMGYLQYRVTLNTTDTNITPTVHSISIHYSEDIYYSITGQDDFAQGTSYNLTRSNTGRLTLKRALLNYADNGTFRSQIMNGSDEFERWLDLYWYGEQPITTTVDVYTRTGNTSTVDGSWSGWALVNSPIDSPDYQYIQVMVEMSTIDTSRSPSISSIQVHGASTASSDTGGEINVNVALPQITDMLLWETGYTTDLMDQRVDAANEYSLLIRGNYSAGWSDNIQLDIWAWYDSGTETTTYDASMESGADRSKANLQFHFQYNSGTGGADGTWTQLYPTTGEIEITSFDERVVASARPYEERDRWVRINFTLGPQVRNASGDGGWTTSTDHSDTGQSFNDVYSWNINTTIIDVATPDAGNSWYDEFGVYKYTSMGVGGNPSGGAPPGTGVVLSPGTNLTYSANTEYNVNISVTDLWDVNFTQTINATNIQAWNMNATSADNSSFSALTAMPGGNMELYLWYNSTSIDAPPADYGNTSVGPEGIVDTTTWISWTVNIPVATPEGVYVGTIKYTIYHP